MQQCRRAILVSAPCTKLNLGKCPLTLHTSRRLALLDLWVLDMDVCNTAAKMLQEQPGLCAASQVDAAMQAAHYCKAHFGTCSLPLQGQFTTVRKSQLGLADFSNVELGAYSSVVLQDASHAAVAPVQYDRMQLVHCVLCFSYKAQLWQIEHGSCTAATLAHA